MTDYPSELFDPFDYPFDSSYDCPPPIFVTPNPPSSYVPPNAPSNYVPPNNAPSNAPPNYAPSYPLSHRWFYRVNPSSELEVEPSFANRNMSISNTQVTESVVNTQPMIGQVSNTQIMMEPVSNTQPMMRRVFSTQPMMEPVFNTQPMMEPASNIQPMMRRIPNTQAMMESVFNTQPTMEQASNTQPTREPFLTPSQMDGASFNTQATMGQVFNTQPMMRQVFNTQPMMEPPSNNQATTESDTRAHPHFDQYSSPRSSHHTTRTSNHRSFRQSNDGNHTVTHNTPMRNNGSTGSQSESTAADYSLIRGSILRMAFTYSGCRALQNILKDASPSVVEDMYSKLKSHLNELMVDRCGNYLFQALVKSLDVSLITDLVSNERFLIIHS